MWYSKRLVIAGLLAFWIGVSSPRPQHSLMEPRKGEFWTSGRQYGHWPETGFESSNGTFGQSGCGWLNFRVAREILWKSAAMANFGGGHRAKQSLLQPQSNPSLESTGFAGTAFERAGHENLAWVRKRRAALLFCPVYDGRWVIHDSEVGRHGEQ